MAEAAGVMLRTPRQAEGGAPAAPSGYAGYLRDLFDATPPVPDVTIAFSKLTYTVKMPAREEDRHAIKT